MTMTTASTNTRIDTLARSRKHERETLGSQSGPTPKRTKPSSVSAAAHPTFTVENYLKGTMRLCLETGSEWTSTGALANALHVTPGSVSIMLKTLSENGFADYKPYAGIRLTAKGRTLGAKILRRHRIIETFLVRILEFRWDEVHAEAENMEHAMSDLVIDRLDDFLGRPCFDPHGDPIPTPGGTMRGDSPGAKPLSGCEPGDSFRIVRVLNQEPTFLRYLSSCGVGIGAGSVVESNESAAGTITFRLRGRSVVLSQIAAAQLLVEIT